MQDPSSVMTAELLLASLALGEIVKDLTFIANTGYSLKGEQAAHHFHACDFAASTASRLGPLPVAQVLTLLREYSPRYEIKNGAFVHLKFLADIFI